ncbi:hypothetical protein JW823_05700 [bacterium]|nr:hypothetical protein [candidate division CSSED10-310 bacterium]
MMSRFTIRCLIIVLLMCAVMQSTMALDFKKSKKDGPLCAIMDFENKTADYWWGSRLGRAAADVLSTELVKGTPLRCMEREKLDSIMKEKNLAASGLTTPDTYVKMGGLLGVKYIITGAVTSFGEKQVGGYGVGVGGKLKTYHTAIDVRIIDTTTGEIVFADSADAEKHGLNLHFRGVGGGEDFDEDACNKLFRIASKDMAKKISDALE